jgi:hypothetical protein
VAGVTFHRPPGVAVIANISPGSLRLKLDAYAVAASTTDLQWESEGASSSSDRYELRINGGAVQVTLDDKAIEQTPAAATVEPESPVDAASALEILLDGVEKRISSRSSS